MKKQKINLKKLKGYFFLTGAIFFGFLLGVYLALPHSQESQVVSQPEQKKIEKEEPTQGQIGEIITKSETLDGEIFVGKWLSLGEFLKVYQNADILVLDVRSGEEYKAGHIKSAKPFPPEVIDNYYQFLPANKKIIFYANDPTFEAVKRAYRKLTEYDLDNIFMVDVTYGQWESAGHPTERGNPYEERL